MEQTGSEQQHILVIEDDESISELLYWILTDAGYQVTCAASLNDARKVIDDELPDLIIADLLLPDGLGSDLVSEIRRRFPDRGPDAIVMSAVPQAERHAAEAGARRCLTKPFDLGELLGIVADSAGSGSRELQPT